MGYYDYEYEPPEIPEYLMQIDEIVAQEVQRQVEASNADIQALREKETLWIEKTNKLQEELCKANLAVGEAAGKAKQAEEEARLAEEARLKAEAEAKAKAEEEARLAEEARLKAEAEAKARAEEEARLKAEAEAKAKAI